MEKIVKDLKKLVRFKDTLSAGDIVLIAAKKPQMLVYGLICEITRDDTKRDEWWHVSLQLLSLPPRKVTWILRTPQMTGMEIFTMDGEERFMKGVDLGPQHSTGAIKKVPQGKGKTSLRRVK